ncbi:MAG: hypothetical protein QM770_13900 [Tepidisphaeraceae bacterium]
MSLMNRAWVGFGFVSIVALAVGCGTTREYTFVTTPPDAALQLNGKDVTATANGRPSRLTFTSEGQTFTVTATRYGFEDMQRIIGSDTPPGEVRFDLKPQSKPVTVLVEPIAANITLDGQRLSNGLVDSMTFNLPFALDSGGQPTPHRLRAERKGFAPVEGTINWNDPTSRYVLKLEPLRKDITINTEPAATNITLDGVDLGPSPVTLKAQPFTYDTVADKFVPRKLVATCAGYAPTESVIDWDEGQSSYAVKLDNLRKTVSLLIDPPDSTVKLDGKPVLPDAKGDRRATLTFVPVDDSGTLPTLKVDVSLSRPGEIWTPHAFNLGWDEGKPQYSVKLQEVLTRVVPIASVTPALGTDGAWKMSTKRGDTTGVKSVIDGKQGKPTRVTDLPAGSSIGSFAISPDGSMIVYSLLDTSDEKRPRARLQLQRTDGTGGVTQLTDGRSLDLTPSFTPSGDRITFSSDRGGGHMHLWSVAVDGSGGATRLTTGDADHFWPTLDSNPKPTVYYEARLPGQPDARLFSAVLGTVSETDLVKVPAFQPRVSPRNDAVVFASVNPSTGKRDLYRVGVKGSGLVALTSTPDTDEREPTWSADGVRIAYTTDAKSADGAGTQSEIYVMTEAGNSAKRVTENDSLDDQPAFDPTGDAVYFRSNRSGKWDVWALKVAH